LLSGYYFISAYRGWKQPFAPMVDSAIVLSHRALTIDSTLGGPWVNMLSRASYLDDDWETARRVATGGIRLAGHDPVVQLYAGIYFGEVEGRLDTAITLIRRSADTEPLTLNLNSLGDMYMRARRYDSAAAVLRRAILFDASVPGPHLRLVTVMERRGRYADAIEARRAMKDPAAEEYARGFASGGPSGYQQVLAKHLRDRIDSLTRAMSAPFRVPRDTIPPTREGRIAALYAQLGEWTEAMDWIVKERERRPRRFRLYVTNPDFAGIRNDPRFAALVKEDGLESLLSVPRNR
jgi:tetratricopeptide (TPR) repeat protein